MGMRNPDRIPIAMWRSKIETVTDMRAAGWDVVSKCHRCGLMMAVNLRLVGSGAKTSLWNRKEPCRRIGCGGFVDFLARVPPRGDCQQLTAPWPDDRLTRNGGET